MILVDAAIVARANSKLSEGQQVGKSLFLGGP